MTGTAITVENLSKRYVLGLQAQKGDGLRHAIEDALRAPVNWMRSRYSLNGKTQEEFWALRDVNLEVRQGEVVGIIGRNGAGKSTLLKILSRITDPTSGRIRLCGRVASLLEVGTGFHPELTGRENIFLNGAILGMARLEIKRKFDEIVAFSGIDKFIDTPVKRYSSGMYVRLAFAVAAHLEPEILIVDEVLAVGDAAFQKKCLGKMSEVAREGRTILFVSHNMAAVENLCHRGIVLQNGRVGFAGTQAEAIGVYLTSCSTASDNLRERTDRTGTGQVRIVGMVTRDSEGREVGHVTSGQDVDLWLYFETQPGFKSKSVVASINVRTQMGTPVFLQHNRLTREEFGDLPASGAFVCTLPRLPLPAGSFGVDVSLQDNHGRAGAFLDLVENAFELVVVEGNYHGFGEVPPASHGFCLVDGRWRLESGLAVAAQ